MGAALAGSDVFRAVADPTRRTILTLLLESDRSFADLRRAFRVSQPAISQHLRVLRRAGLVDSERAGRGAVYRLQAKPLKEIYAWAERFREVGDPYGHVWRIVGKKMTAKKGE